MVIVKARRMRQHKRIALRLRMTICAACSKRLEQHLLKKDVIYRRRFGMVVEGHSGDLPHGRKDRAKGKERTRLDSMN